MGITNSRTDLSEKLLDPWDVVVERSYLEVWVRECEAIWKTDKGFCEFMEGGACKESFRVMVACLEEGSKKCVEPCFKFFDCMYSHSVYYQPYIALLKTLVDHSHKERQAIHARNQAFRDDDALAARNQAFRE
ncbi:unnamed protein product [Arabis nemorensis]|uniref:GCK domain-containing protein n=1 Tax=Arabis nemorensis TaxID=586526 RepID=A0A565B7D5_9BRAS|nr:unnamed protein product [Arabis nemorensis]